MLMKLTPVWIGNICHQVDVVLEAVNDLALRFEISPFGVTQLRSNLVKNI